jgi:predicted DNA-binding transcriptional regulator YafY
VDEVEIVVHAQAPLSDSRWGDVERLKLPRLVSYFWQTAKMRASRLLTVLMLLQQRGRVSAQALAAATQSSVRTIYRDIDHLSAAGVPVWAEQGRHGGFRLRDGWRTELTGLTASEARSVFMAGLPGPAAELGLGQAMAAAQLKLLAALPAAAQADATRVGARFHLDPVDWFRDAVPPRHLQAVAQAVWDTQRLKLRYESWQRVSERVLEPLGLVLKAGTWYLAARRAGQLDVRAYRVAAVESLQVLQQRFAPPPAFDLAAWWRASTARFEAGVYTTNARLRVDEEGFVRLCAFGPRVAAAAFSSAAPCGDAAHEGWVDVEVPIESVDHAVREMLDLAGHAEVLAPHAQRHGLRDAARAMLARYAD